MTKTMTATEAQAQFFDVLNEAQAGTEIIIERDNRPVARVHHFTEAPMAGASLAQQRLQALARMRQWAKESVIGAPLTIEDIISARDEGRR